MTRQASWKLFKRILFNFLCYSVVHSLFSLALAGSGKSLLSALLPAGEALRVPMLSARAPQAPIVSSRRDLLRFGVAAGHGERGQRAQSE